MIKLEKRPTPPHLEGVLNTWTTELLTAIEDEDEANQRRIEKHYTDRTIKMALMEETNGTCAYCESQLKVTGYPRVEHIMPRKLAPELTFAWPNLTIACEMCNGRKSDYWDLA